MVWILFFAFYDVEYARGLWWQFEFDATAPRALRAVVGVAVLGLAVGLSQLLRPAAGHVAAPTTADLERARAETGIPEGEFVMHEGETRFFRTDEP